MGRHFKSDEIAEIKAVAKEAFLEEAKKSEKSEKASAVKNSDKDKKTFTH